MYLSSHTDCEAAALLLVDVTFTRQRRRCWREGTSPLTFTGCLQEGGGGCQQRVSTVPVCSRVHLENYCSTSEEMWQVRFNCAALSVTLPTLFIWILLIISWTDQFVALQVRNVIQHPTLTDSTVAKHKWTKLSLKSLNNIWFH